MSNFLHLSASQLRAMAHLKEKIEVAMAEMKTILTSGYPAPAITAPKRRKVVVKKPAAKPAKKSGMSAAAKAKLSAIAKARWAKLKAEGKSKM